MGRRKKSEKELLESPEASAEARGARVRRIRNMANLTRLQLCEYSGININSLKGWEIGRYGGLTWSGAEKIINQTIKQGVQCTVDWLMYGIGVGPSAQSGFTDNTIPPLTSVSTQDEDDKIAQELSLFREHYSNAVDFIVSDDGMSPVYQRGEYVAGVCLTPQQIDTVIGTMCIVQMENGDILLRQLLKGSEPNSYTLICLNMAQITEPVLPNVKVLKVAPVIFHRKKQTIY